MGRLPDNLLIAALETHFTQQTQIRPRLRRQNALHEAAIGRGFHFIQPLQRRLFRVRETIAVILRGFIADGESGVVVRRADQPSKFASKPDICPHRIRYQNGRPGDTVAGSVSVSLTREAIGQAQ